MHVLYVRMYTVCMFRLKEYSSAYEMVKTERNKTMSLIQHASQVHTYAQYVEV